MFLSVAICTYNGSVFLREQLDSIIHQTLHVNEIIICDDASKDETVSILNEYQLKYPSLIKIFINNFSLGTIKNFEKAINLTKGDLIFLSDQDDVWVDTKVEKMVKFFGTKPCCQLLFSNGILIDELGAKVKGSLWSKWGFDHQLREMWKNNEFAFKELLRNKNKITGATICFKSTLKPHITPIQLPYGYWHDAWLGIHAAALNGLYFLDGMLIKYRIHKNQQVGVSSKIGNEVIFNSNKNSISKENYYKLLRTMYPKKRNLIPKRASFFGKIKNKIKNYIKPI